MRAARGKIFAARQEKQELWARERDSAVAAAQETARKQVHEAKIALQAQTNAAHRTIENSVDELANEILRAILPNGRAAAGSVR